MKITFVFIRLLKFFLNTFLVFFLFVNLPFQTINASAMTNLQNDMVFEELRLNVPPQYKSIWFEAEHNIWEPWLAKQKGFLGRQIFYNETKGEALILVNWKNRKLWKDIPLKEVVQIQKKFEEVVKKSIKVEKNPFQLTYEGELKSQI